jgi:hypothetical protein
MNKKVRSRPSKSGPALAISPTGKRPQMRHLQSRSRQLNEEIHRLECTIAAAPHAMRSRQLAYIDTLPPPEPLNSPARRKTGRLPLQQQRARKRRRVGLVVELAVVLGALAAALGWMNQWFHLWGQ